MDNQTDCGTHVRAALKHLGWQQQKKGGSKRMTGKHIKHLVPIVTHPRRRHKRRVHIDAKRMGGIVMTIVVAALWTWIIIGSLSIL